MNQEIEQKKAWQNPEVVVFGGISELTQQVKAKQPGFRDDFNVTGISNP